MFLNIDNECKVRSKIDIRASPNLVETQRIGIRNTQFFELNKFSRKRPSDHGMDS